MTGTGGAGERGKRSQQQRLDALRKANEIRSCRSQLKKDIAAGTFNIVDLLASPPEFAESERLVVLLSAVPGYGPTRVSKLLLKTKISESKRLAGLTERQRAELIQHFRQ